MKQRDLAVNKRNQKKETKMEPSRRSAFKPVQAKQKLKSHKDDKTLSKDKRQARKHDAEYPEGADLLSRQNHPVGDQERRPRGARSVI